MAICQSPSRFWVSLEEKTNGLVLGYYMEKIRQNVLIFLNDPTLWTTRTERLRLHLSSLLQLLEERAFSASILVNQESYVLNLRPLIL